MHFHQKFTKQIIKAIKLHNGIEITAKNAEELYVAIKLKGDNGFPPLNDERCPATGLHQETSDWIFRYWCDYARIAYKARAFCLHKPIWEKDGNYIIRYKIYKVSDTTSLRPNEILPSISVSNERLDTDKNAVLVKDNIKTMEDGLKLLAECKSTVVPLEFDLMVTEFALQAEIYNTEDDYPQDYYIVAMTDLSLNPNGHGGYRAGAGRKKEHFEGARPRTFYCSEGEGALIKALLPLLKEDRDLRYSVYELLTNRGHEEAVSWLLEVHKLKPPKPKTK